MGAASMVVEVAMAAAGTAEDVDGAATAWSDCRTSGTPRTGGRAFARFSVPAGNDLRGALKIFCRDLETIQQTAPAARVDRGLVSGADAFPRPGDGVDRAVVSRALAVIQQSRPRNDCVGLSAFGNSTLPYCAAGVSFPCLGTWIRKFDFMERTADVGDNCNIGGFLGFVFYLLEVRSRRIHRLDLGLNKNRAASVAQSRSMRDSFCEGGYAALVCVQTRSLSGSMPQRLPTASRSGFNPQ